MSVLEQIPLHVDECRTAVHAPAGQWVQAVRGEYLEIPCLSLTRAQVQSFWRLDEDECDEVLDALLASGFLKVMSTGSFVRA